MERNKIERKSTTYLENVYMKSDRLRKKHKGFKELIFEMCRHSQKYNSLM